MWLLHSRSFCCAAIPPRIFCYYAIRKHLNQTKNTFSVDLVGTELTIIVTLINESKYSPSVLASSFILSLVYFSIRPSLSSLTVLFILKPLSNIACSISVCICSLSAGFVIQPLSLINVSIRMVQNTTTIGLVALPFTNITWTIGPNLFPVSLSLSVFPFPLVWDTIIELNLRHLNPSGCSDHLPNEFVVLVCPTPADKIFIYLFFLFLGTSSFLFSVLRINRLSASHFWRFFQWFVLLIDLWWIFSMFWLGTLLKNIFRFFMRLIFLLFGLYLFDDFISFARFYLHVWLRGYFGAGAHAYSHLRLIYYRIK